MSQWWSFTLCPISFMKGEETCILDLERDDEAIDLGCGFLCVLSVFGSASTSSSPDRTGLTTGSDSVEWKLEDTLFIAELLDCRYWLYWPGEYFNKLDSSLLGGGLVELNVLGWMGVVSLSDGYWRDDRYEGREEDGVHCVGDEGFVGDRGSVGDVALMGDVGWTGDGGVGWTGDGGWTVEVWVEWRWTGSTSCFCASCLQLHSQRSELETVLKRSTKHNPTLPIHTLTPTWGADCSLLLRLVFQKSLEAYSV